MPLLFQNRVQKTQQITINLLSFYVFVSPIEDTQIYFEMCLLCNMMLTTDGGELLKTKVRPIFRFNPPSVFLNKHQIEIRAYDPLLRA
jgi:hypothetical protein